MHGLHTCTIKLHPYTVAGDVTVTVKTSHFKSHFNSLNTHINLQTTGNQLLLNYRIQLHKIVYIEYSLFQTISTTLPHPYKSYKTISLYSLYSFKTRRMININWELRSGFLHKAWNKAKDNLILLNYRIQLFLIRSIPNHFSYTAVSL